MNATTTLTLDSIEEFRRSLIVKSMSPNTIRAYTSDLSLALDWMTSQPETMDTETAAALWLNATRDEAKPRTTLRRLASLRAFAKWSGSPLFLQDYRTPSPAKAQPHPLPEGIQGVDAMCVNAPNVFAEALFALQGYMGLRISEALEVTPSNFDTDQMTLLVRGKGDKERLLPIPAKAWEHIKSAYMIALVRQEKVVQYSDRAARELITNMGVMLNFKRRISSHDLRATFATDLLRRTANLRVVQEWLGHASSRTTEVYTQVTLDDLREVV